MSSDLIALQKQLDSLKKENAELKLKSTPDSFSMKVSPKKCLSIYGLQKFPVSLYKDQWNIIFSKIDEIKEFIKSHDDELA